MATDKPFGDGHRNGAVRNRAEVDAIIIGKKHMTKPAQSSRQTKVQMDQSKVNGVRKEG
jgi:hypothetical protein